MPTTTDKEPSSPSGTLNAPAPSSPTPKRQRRSRKPVEAQKQDAPPPNRDLPKRIAIALVGFPSSLALLVQTLDRTLSNSFSNSATFSRQPKDPVLTAV